MQQAGYHRANILAETIKTDMQSQLTENNDCLLQYFENMSTDEHSVPSQTETDLSSMTQTQLANALSQHNMQLETLQLLREWKASQGSTANPPSNDNNDSSKRKPQKTPDDATYPRSVTNKYCWTHGGCNHDSKDCKRRARGHQASATFSDKKGGSAAYCST